VSRWLVTGARGQLGHHLLDQLTGEDVVGLARADLDITDGAAVDAAIEQYRPDVVINAAAYTAVDAAEEDTATAFAVNASAPRLLATALRKFGGRLIHVSTDYVFDGASGVPYEPDDRTSPRSVYGQSKLDGELAVRQTLPDAAHVVRTAWVYGGPGPNFVDTMRRLESARDTIDVVDDQIGSPTWVHDLAAALIALGRSQAPPGVLHYANTGQASWCELAREVFRLVGADPARVHAVGTESFPRPAPRPTWSVLSTASWTRLGLPAPRPWQEALAESLRTG
jgi:dTDP-4-dehydrorhamnose reductase